MTLSHALRSTTSAAHQRAEQSSFVDDLLQGRSCSAAFAALTVQLASIYAALEAAIVRTAGDPIVVAVDDRRLDRCEALRLDLATLRVRGIPVLPATEAYVAVLAAADAETVLAHHYVRYLGDLSGGQVIARLVQRSYGVPEAALHFYRFDGIEKLKPYKDAYRAALDALDVTDAQRERILARAIEAFELNEAVFADLARARGPRHAAAGVAA